MISPVRLVIFDVDGTLVDSQGDIVSALMAAFADVGVAVPPRETMLGIVGLSLDVAMPVLAPEQTAAVHKRMVQAYKDSYMQKRADVGAAQSSPMYPGAMDALLMLGGIQNVVLGVATGKSRRGLDKLIEGHGLEGMFVTQQVADFHPSKPHPSMILQAMADTGTTPENTLMIGDTSFDMDMAVAAGVRGIGVNWGYHGREKLENAHVVVDDFAQMISVLQTIWASQA